MSESNVSQTNVSSASTIKVPRGLSARMVVPAGATIGELVPNLPAPVSSSAPVSSAAPKREKDTWKQIRLTPEEPKLPETLTEDTVIHLEGGMLFTPQELPKYKAKVELHVHSGTFLPLFNVGAHTSVTLDSGAMGTLVLYPGGSAYVAAGGKAKYVESGGYARCARNHDVTYADDSNVHPVELTITSGNSMTLHNGASARIHIKRGGYAYLLGAHYGYGHGDQPAPSPHATDIAGTLKVVNGCVTEARIQNGGELVASKCDLEDIRVSSGGTMTVVRGAVSCVIESGGTAILKNAELNSVVAYQGAVVRIHNCVHVFHRKTDTTDEYFSVIGEELDRG